MLRVNQLNGFGVGLPRVLRGGLVLYLDAGNPDSYPGSGATWTDLSTSSINGTLTNGPTFNSADGGSITFDGANDYVQCSGSLTLTAATFIMWMKRGGPLSGFAGFLYSRGTDVTGLSATSGNQIGYAWNDAPPTWLWSSGLVLPTTWAMCALSVTSSDATLYLYQSSGLTTAINTTSHASTVLDDIRIGSDDLAARYFNGDIAQAIVYNRALNANEIEHIFNATRRRYGI